MSYTLIKIEDDVEYHKITALKSAGVFDETNVRPTVNDALIISTISRWYRTSLIQEILEDSPKRVKFRTVKSVYIWEDNSIE